MLWRLAADLLSPTIRAFMPWSDRHIRRVWRQGLGVELAHELSVLVPLQGELLLRCEELRDTLWALCDAKHDAAEAARLKLAADGSAAEQVALMGNQLTGLVQVELDR